MARSVKSVAKQALKADEKLRAKNATTSTQDSFQNFSAKLGIGTANMSSGATYGLNALTRQRTLLEWIHRGTWIGGLAVDIVADDMTKRGIDIRGDIDPEHIDHLARAAVSWKIWQAINSTIKWARLYGGALGFLLIDGQDPKTPLRIETIRKGQFKGMLALDRWMVEPDLSNLVTDLGPELGLPKYYHTNTMAPAMPNATIHHSRCLRMVGIQLPYWQSLMENLWGISVIERLYDRMVAFDSASQGAAQLVYKSYLRTVNIKGLRELVAAGGPALDGLVKYMGMISSFQSIEGLTILDGDDIFNASSAGGNSARGLADLLLSFGEQLSGSLQIPLVRLFGQSPRGMNSSGESELRTYYDGINMQQEQFLRVAVTMIYRCLAASEGITLPEGFWFDFRPLWILDDLQKAQVAATTFSAIAQLDQAGIIDRATGLKEVKQSSKITGIGTNVSDEAIKEAEQEPPPSAQEMLSMEQQKQAMEEGQEPESQQSKKTQLNKSNKTNKTGKTVGKTKDRMLGDVEVFGLPVVIEHLKGEERYGVRLPADYGYIRGTDSSERGEQMDCFIGPDPNGLIFIVDAYDRFTGEYDESKILMGFASAQVARMTFWQYYGMMPQQQLVGNVYDPVTADELKRWLATGDVTKPYIEPTYVGYVSATSDASQRCDHCQNYASGLCADPAVQRDPRVPFSWDSQNKSVSPAGWCTQFMTKTSYSGRRDDAATS
jgi:hypothetical protein